MPKSPSFIIHDSSINIWSEIDSDEVLYKKLKTLLKKLGFSWKQDPYTVKNYPSLAKTYHYGILKDLEFCSQIHPKVIEFDFFQNINFENPYGGKYDFDKVSKMPYVIRLRFQKIISCIKDLLKTLEFKDESRYIPENSFDAVMFRRSEIGDYHKSAYDPAYQQEYNVTDRDDNRLRDGDIRYFYDNHGILMRGTVYYNLNNMWFVILNHLEYTNVSASSLFSWKPNLPKRIQPRRYHKLNLLLKESIESENFEKAIIYRDLIKK